LEIKAVNSDQFPQKAYRPRHSVLSLKKSQQTGFIIPTWQEALKMSGMIDK
ncbi:sugar nucleotide-binding protein, partial [Oenococcus oeni]